MLHVRRTLDEIEIAGSKVVAGAGASFPGLARAAAERGLAGIEFGAGIPGCVGGAIVMNAGWHEFEIGNVATSVTYLESGRCRDDLSPRRLPFRLSQKRIPRPGRRRPSCGARLGFGRRSAVKDRLLRFADSRKANQPTELPRAARSS